MAPKLSSFLAELVFELVEAGKEESAQEIRSLSVRIKTYDSSDPDGQQLLCHFKVSSSCPLPVEELLREQKLSELAQFLLHVQQQADEDCHCVLMRTVPDRTEPDSGGRFLASSVSLTVRRELGPRAAELCPCGQDRAHGSQTEKGPWERGDRCGGGGPNSDGGEGTGCSRCSRGKIAVASVRLGESPSGAKAEKEGAHLHVRFLAEKMHILEEGKIIHDFLHQLKLFHPTMKLSFVLSIDALVTRASYRFQGFRTVQGHSVVIDPKYFSRKSSLASRVFWGCGERAVGRRSLCARALCLACHVTHCQPRPLKTAGAYCHGVLSIHVYGPNGVPCLKTNTLGLLRRLTSEIDWQQFGMEPTFPASEVKEGSGGQARIALTERSSLPGWLGEAPFVLSLHVLCCPVGAHTAQEYCQGGQLVEEVLEGKAEVTAQDAGDGGGGDGDGGDGGGGGHLCRVVTAALVDLYRPAPTHHPVPCQRTSATTTRSTVNSSHSSSSQLERLLPMISKSVADIYTRSHSHHFRESMESITQGLELGAMRIVKLLLFAQSLSNSLHLPPQVQGKPRLETYMAEPFSTFLACVNQARCLQTLAVLTENGQRMESVLLQQLYAVTGHPDHPRPQATHSLRSLAPSTRQAGEPEPFSQHPQPSTHYSSPSRLLSSPGFSSAGTIHNLENQQSSQGDKALEMASSLQAMQDLKRQKSQGDEASAFSSQPSVNILGHQRSSHGDGAFAFSSRPKHELGHQRSSHGDEAFAFSSQPMPDVNNQQSFRGGESLLSAMAPEQQEQRLSRGPETMDTQDTGGTDLTSVEEETWMSQMEQELTL